LINREYFGGFRTKLFVGENTGEPFYERGSAKTEVRGQATRCGDALAKRNDANRPRVLGGTFEIETTILIVAGPAARRASGAGFAYFK
jgi:hypothetical protein